jgi:hypothetical protein
MGDSTALTDDNIQVLILQVAGTPRIGPRSAARLRVLEQALVLEQMVEDVPRSIRWMERVALVALKFSWTMERCLSSVIHRVRSSSLVNALMQGTPSEQ